VDGQRTVSRSTRWILRAELARRGLRARLLTSKGPAKVEGGPAGLVVLVVTQFPLEHTVVVPPPDEAPLDDKPCPPPPVVMQLPSLHATDEAGVLLAGLEGRGGAVEGLAVAVGAHRHAAPVRAHHCRGTAKRMSQTSSVSAGGVLKLLQKVMLLSPSQPWP
jgi:hypothetical protein